MKRIFIAFTAMMLSACSGNIILSPLDPGTMGSPPKVTDINSTDGKTKLGLGYSGLIVYLSSPKIEVDRFTQIQVLATDGKTLILSGDCNSNDPHAITQKIVNVPDRGQPFLLQYHHGLLETYTFAATLNTDGTLASINTSSTPDQGKTLANLTSAAASGAGIAAKAIIAPAPGKPACTQTPAFDKYEPVPQ